MTRSIRFIAALCLVLPLTTAAFAGEMLAPRERLADRRSPAEPNQRAALPLLYALPALGSGEAQLLEIRIVQTKYWLVREIVSIPAGTPAGAVVDVLFTHPAELTRLREIETTMPGGLRFMAMIGQHVLTDEPFAEIEARGATLSLDAAVGEIRTVEARKSPRLRIVTQSKDPICAEQCDTALASCLEWADPRGSDANLCYSWHWSCWSQCGDIPDPCTEPKSTSTYTTNTLLVSSYIGSVCAPVFWPPNSGNKYWDHYSRLYRVDHYTRTVHCDDSYTDTLTNSTSAYATCWSPTFYSCGFAVGGQPSPVCN